MVTLDVLSLLEKKGKTKYWLYHQLAVSHFESIRISQADRMVTAPFLRSVQQILIALSKQ